MVCIDRHHKQEEQILKQFTFTTLTRLICHYFHYINNTQKSSSYCIPQVDIYRLISLTSYVGKLMERLTNSTHWVPWKRSLSDNQAGFRWHRSTEDLVTYIGQEIEDVHGEKKQTIAVWVDLDKTFNKVWKNGSKVYLYSIKAHTYNWTSQYLTNRKARVQSKRHISTKKTLEEKTYQYEEDPERRRTRRNFVTHILHHLYGLWSG